MSSLARFIARHLWWAMMWLMRRGWIKRLQRNSTRILPRRIQDRAWRSMVRQNAFARRYGLRMLTVSITMLLASAAVTWTYFAALWLIENEYLTMSDERRARAQNAGR